MNHASMWLSGRYDPEDVMKNWQIILLVFAFMLVFFIIWFWCICNFGIEGYGNMELYR